MRASRPQGQGPPGASRLQGRLQRFWAFWEGCRFWEGSPQIYCRTFPEPWEAGPWRPPERWLNMWYSHQQKNQCTVYTFGPLGWLEAGLGLPMYGKSPQGLYTSTLHRLLPLSCLVRLCRLTCIFSVWPP